MKNFKSFAFIFCFAFVFILSKFQIGGSKLYYYGDESQQVTTDINLAKKFDNIKDVYDFQNKLKDTEWCIENIG